MYLRTTKRHNKDGATRGYYQLAEDALDPTQRLPHRPSSPTLTAPLPWIAQHCCASLGISRVCQGGIDLLRGVSPPGGSHRHRIGAATGVVHVAQALWEELGIGEVLQGLEPRGPVVPHALAFFTMVANHSRAPVQADALCVLDERAYLPEAFATLDHLYALDFLDTHIEAIEREALLRTADLFKADVDLIFWDTTSVYFEVDDEDTECETKRDTTLPPLRKRGYNKEGANSRRW